MGKQPAFLFYTGDFSTGTQFMSDEQVGKYLRLLMAQHHHGHLPEEHMLMICKSYDKHIFSKFKRDSDGLYYNQRFEDEVNKRNNYCETRGDNRRGKKNISNSYDIHMENENKDILNKRKGADPKIQEIRLKWKTMGLEEFIEAVRGLWIEWNKKELNALMKLSNRPKEFIFNQIGVFLGEQFVAGIDERTPADLLSHFSKWVLKKKEKEAQLPETKRVPRAEDVLKQMGK